jgi:8-oxo-dGTP pyrophosphatase MutT (NUDIX family)
MAELQFSNRPNQAVYLSRHVAVMVVPVFQCADMLFVPLGQRSEKVSDSGKFCLPCGYLDYDESGSEAAIREAYEELGLDLRGLLSAQPWFVQSDPSKDARQNVTLRFGCVVDVDRLPDLKIDNSEVVVAEWRTVDHAIAFDDLAFNHAQIIDEYLAYKGIPF